MTYTTKKCPNCSKAYTRFEASINASKRGSPIRTCQFCGAQFFDDDYFEPALKPYKADSYTSSLAKATIGLAIILFPLPTLLTRYFEWSPIVYFVLLGIFIIFVIKCAINNRDTTDKENEDGYKAWIESDNRLKNREYAMLLKNHGFKVPKKYLEPKVQMY